MRLLNISASFLILDLAEFVKLDTRMRHYRALFRPEA